MKENPRPYSNKDKEEANKKTIILTELEKAKINKEAIKEAGRSWSTKLPSERK